MTLLQKLNDILKEGRLKHTVNACQDTVTYSGMLMCLSLMFHLEKSIVTGSLYVSLREPAVIHHSVDYYIHPFFSFPSFCHKFKITLSAVGVF